MCDSFAVKKLKRVSAFGLFRDKKPPTWERGYIVGYSLHSAKGELHFKSKNRKSSTVFPYPSLTDKLYLDKTPRWNQLIVGKTVLVEFQPGKYQTGKIVAQTNPSSKRFHRYGGKIAVKISNRKMAFDYRKVRLKGKVMNAMKLLSFILLPEPSIKAFSMNILRLRMGLSSKLIRHEN